MIGITMELGYKLYSAEFQIRRVARIVARVTCLWKVLLIFLRLTIYLSLSREGIHV
jgi:hypothetical protein